LLFRRFLHFKDDNQTQCSTKDGLVLLNPFFLSFSLWSETYIACVSFDQVFLFLPSMKRTCVTFTATLLMVFTVAVKAFARQAATRPSLVVTGPLRTVRWMSSSGTEGPDTTIVDVCTQKIKEALDSDKVKVTGK
jgi:hypothetical protein